MTVNGIPIHNTYRGQKTAGSQPPAGLPVPNTQPTWPLAMPATLAALPTAFTALPLPKLPNQEKISELWKDKTKRYTAYQAVIRAGDRASHGYYSLARAGTHLTNNQEHLLHPAATLNPSMWTYRQILRLDDKAVKWKDATDLKKVGQTIRHNTKGLKETLKHPSRIQVNGQAAKRYLKNTVWEGHTRDLRNLFDKNVTDKKLGTGAVRIFALGSVAYDIGKTTKDSYQQAKVQEDGSLKSRLNTYLTTGKTFAKKTTKNLILWEVVGAGMALGKALIPLGTFPIGGIITAAFCAAGASKVLDKLLPDHKPATPPSASPQPAEAHSADNSD